MACFLAQIRSSRNISLIINNFNKSFRVNKRHAPIFATHTRTIITNPGKDDNPPITMQEVHNLLAKKMGVEKGYRIIPASREHLLPLLPQSREELEPRSMQDSFTSAIIPLSQDLDLQDKYISFLGYVRLGRLLEDMDIFAVWVLEQHIKNPREKEGLPSPYTFVTVLVDKIDFTNYSPVPNEDIRLSGHVSWVGRSSAEIVVWLEQKQYGIWQKVTRAIFLMAARNPTNTGSAIINPIKPATPEEEKILAGGDVRKKNRKLESQKSLTKVVPSEAEQKEIHSMFLKTIPTHEVLLTKRILPELSQWMEDCTLSNIVFSHPENRNLHNKVFGGFMMRQACEISWVLAYIFGKSRPQLKHISDVIFHKPISVNSIIRLSAYVAYTQMNFIEISVYAESYSKIGGDVNTTNEFHFTYEMPGEVHQVVPKTYHEAMMYLDGKRHFYEAVQDVNLIEKSFY